MLAKFFSDVLPAEGRFSLWTRHNKKHIWTASQDELVQAVEQRLDMHGVYFATAAFGDAISENTGAIARTQANVLARKSYHLDFDAGAAKLAKHGPDEVYPTQRDAITDVMRFIKATGIKPTYIVNSGEGIHVYFCLSEEIDGATWKRTADGLSKLVAQYGLKQDNACTTDSARILRPVGTLHDNDTPVSILAQSSKLYSQVDFETAVVSKLDTPLPPVRRERERKSLNDDVLSVQGPPKSVKPIIQKCAAFRSVAKVRGDVVEPLWRAMLGVVKHTIEGEKAAHHLSCGHPDYDYADTQAKLDRWSAGPTTCEQFRLYCGAECAACKHNGAITSPIQLGVMTTAQVEQLPEEVKPEPLKKPKAEGTPWENCLPAGFDVINTRNGNLLVWKMPVETENEDGDKVTSYVDIPITHDIFWFSSWADAEHDADGAQTVMVKWERTYYKSYKFDQSLIANQQKLREYLASKSVITSTHKHANRAMEEYTKAQINRIRDLAQRPKITARFGLRIQPDGTMMCAQGKYVIHADGRIQEAMLGSELAPLAQQFVLPLPPNGDSMWDASVWDSHILPRARRHVEFFRKHYARPGLEKYQLATMMVLASPLMAFATGEYISGNELPPNGLSVSLYSQNGGRGKSTLMKAISLAYAKPGGITTDMNQLGSTDKARIARMTMMGTLPIGLDEMGQISAKSATELVYAIANGASRQRATQDGGLNLGSTWSFVAMLASNKSQREMLACGSPESPAVQYRMLELDVDNVAEFDHDQRAEFSEEWSSLAECAGSLGAVIHRAICQLGVEQANKLVMNCVNKASERVEADQTARFQYRGLGAAMALHVILKNLGLELFDLDTIVEEFRKAHDAAKTFISDSIMPTNGVELLSMMLHDLHDETVVTQEETHRTKTVLKYDRPVNNRIPPVVSVRHIISTRRSCLSVEAARRWASDHGVSLSKIVTDCKEARVMSGIYPSSPPGTAKMYNLLKGMEESNGSMVSCYAIDIARMMQVVGKDYYEELREANPEGADVVPLHQRTPEPEQAPEPQEDVA